MIRTLRRGLGAETLSVIEQQRTNGVIVPVHLMLVHDDGTREVGEVACGRGWGEWVTGVAGEVTCDECLKTVHS